MAPKHPVTARLGSSVFGKQVHTLLHMGDVSLLEFNAKAVRDYDGEAQLLLSPTSSAVAASDAEPHSSVYNDRTCGKDCLCICHTAHRTIPNNLLPKSSRFIASLSRQCSVKECRKRRRHDKESFTISGKGMKRAVGSSIKARWLNLQLFFATFNQQPETSDSLRYVNAGNLQALVKLLHNKSATVNDVAPDGWTLVHTAAYQGFLDIVKYLIRMGANTKAGDIGGRKASDLARVRALIKDAIAIHLEIANAFPDAEDFREDFGFTPIHIATLRIYDPDDTDRPGLPELLQFVKDCNDLPAGQNWSRLRCKYKEKSPLYREIIGAFSEESKRQRGKSAKPYINLIDQPDTTQGWSPFLWAAYTGRLEEMKILFENSADPFIITPTGRNALHHAAESKNPEIMKFALSIGKRDGKWFDINHQDKWQETPLIVAASGSLETVKLLLDRGADKSLQRMDGKVPLHLAGQAKGIEKFELAKILSDDMGPHINFLDESNRPPLFEFLSSASCIDELIKQGAYVNVRDSQRRSAIHHACIENHAGALRRLLEHDRENLATSADEEGFVPLARAFEFKSVACIKVFLQRNIIGDMNERDGMTLAHRAAEMGDVAVLQCVFSHSSYERGRKDRQGRTVADAALQVGTYSGDFKTLIEHYERPREDAKGKGKGKAKATGFRGGESNSRVMGTHDHFSLMR